MYTYNCNQSIYGEIKVNDSSVASYSINKDDVNPPSLSLSITDKELWVENSDACMEDLSAVVERTVS